MVVLLSMLTQPVKKLKYPDLCCIQNKLQELLVKGNLINIPEWYEINISFEEKHVDKLIEIMY